MGHRAALRIRYQAIVIDGLALCPDQNDEYNLFTGAGSPELGQPLCHGGFVGLEFTW